MLERNWIYRALGLLWVRVTVVCFALMLGVLFLTDARGTATYLRADVRAGDMFGSSIAIDGAIAVVSSMKADIGSGQSIARNAGSVNVFARESGVWNVLQTLSASDASNNDNFGFSVAINGDTIAIGSWHSDVNGVGDAGAVYVFKQIEGNWVEAQKLVAPMPQERAHFGVSVAVSGNTIVVGAQKQDNSPTSEADDVGTAYVFELARNHHWTVSAVLYPENPNIKQLFGRSVAIHMDSVVVGAPKKSIGERVNSGAAYIYQKQDDGQWDLLQVLDSGGERQHELFGESVAISAKHLVVSAWHDDEKGKNAGAVYAFEKQDKLWNSSQKLFASDGSAGDKFGFRIDLQDDRLAVGAHLSDISFDEASGAAYFYQHDGVQWNQIEKITPKRSENGAEFGRSVALGSDSILVGAEKSSAIGSASGNTYSFPIAQ